MDTIGVAIYAFFIGALANDPSSGSRSLSFSMLIVGLVWWFV